MYFFEFKNNFIFTKKTEVVNLLPTFLYKKSLIAGYHQAELIGVQDWR
jgi:hypothetical protein